MLNRCKFVLSGLAISWLGITAHSALALVEDFSGDPFTTWSFGIGNNTNNQFAWNSSAPAAYGGDAVGSLSVHLDSALPTARFQRPLGVTLTDSDSFALATRFSFSVTNAPGDQFMQMAFGLVNSALTGGDRTGSFADFSSDNVFHTVEFAYFPNVGFFGGPVLTPVTFGAQKGGGDAFSNFASIFGSGSDLGDNTVGITELPQNVTLEAILGYNGATKVVTLTVNQVNSNGSLTLLTTELPSLDLNSSGYDPSFPYSVDSLAIMAYNDGFTSAGAPSLVADLTFEKFQFTAGIEKPTITIVAADPRSGEKGPSSGRFRVCRTGQTDDRLRVHYTVSGTATSGLDYLPLRGRVTLLPGRPCQRIRVTPIDDIEDESAETVEVTLLPDPAYDIGSPSTATITIRDND